eukprot:scaffold110733_cov66-Phaeocystis_antarctica.AAC.4
MVIGSGIGDFGGGWLEHARRWLGSQWPDLSLGRGAAQSRQAHPEARARAELRHCQGGTFEHAVAGRGVLGRKVDARAVLHEGKVGDQVAVRPARDLDWARELVIREARQASKTAGHVYNARGAVPHGPRIRHPRCAFLHDLVLRSDAVVQHDLRRPHVVVDCISSPSTVCAGVYNDLGDVVPIGGVP